MTPYVEDPRLAEDERLAMEHYERSIKATVRPEDEDKFLVIAVESGDYEIGENYLTVGRDLKTRRPNERLWCMRANAEPATVLRSPRLLGL